MRCGLAAPVILGGSNCVTANQGPTLIYTDLIASYVGPLTSNLTAQPIQQAQGGCERRWRKQQPEGCRGIHQ
jgi:hypothetical protein